MSGNGALVKGNTDNATDKKAHEGMGMLSWHNVQADTRIHLTNMTAFHQAPLSWLLTMFVANHLLTTSKAHMLLEHGLAPAPCAPFRRQPSMAIRGHQRASSEQLVGGAWSYFCLTRQNLTREGIHAWNIQKNLPHMSRAPTARCKVA